VNILTKIFIVLMVPLSVLAGSVFTTHALAEKSYRQRMDQEQNLRILAENDRDASKAVSTSEKSEITRLRTSNAALRDSNKDLTERIAEQKRDFERFREDLNADRDADELTLRGVENQRDALILDSSGLRTQLASALDAEDDATREEAGTLAILHDTQTKLETALATSRVYQEQITVLRERLAKLESGEIASGNVATTSIDLPPVAAVDVHITSTITGVSDGMASIDAGTVKGIRKGNVLYIYRGDQFIAHMEVLTVDDSEASGRIYDRAEGKEPQTGDKAATSLD
jgi:hypothetical protein